MLKTLMKKQLMEVNAWLLMDKKRGVHRSKSSILGLLIVYLILFGFMGAMFFLLSSGLCPPLHTMELDWLYFSVTGLLALMLGLFGSVFTTSASLYEGKDNALLLSMPIPPHDILIARLAGVWFWDVIYTAMAFVPALVCYWIHCGIHAGTVLCGLAAFLLLSLLVLVLSCALGWVVTRLTAKLKRKSFFTVLLSIAFLAIYYLFYFRISELLQALLLHAQSIGAALSKIFPVYWFGQASAGNGLFLLLFGLLVCLCTVATLYVLSRTLLRMATISAAGKKAAYRPSSLKQQTSAFALLRKELRLFTSSATYMTNCALGTLFLLVIGIAALFEAESLRGLTASFSGLAPLLICAAVCMIVSMNFITAPSISLEGKQLWLAQSLPVIPWQLLRAKLTLHFVLTAPAAVLCVVCLSIVFEMKVTYALLCVAIAVLFVLLSAAFGLFLNLKMPNLTWSNETVPIKQSGSVTLAMFGGWGFLVVLGALYFAVRSLCSAPVYLLLCATLFAALSAALLLWLKRVGPRLFAQL